MSDVVLLLGPIAFRDFEVPSGINFGGRQRLMVNRLPGGSRIIDALGRDDSQIVFSGIFTGSDATVRARSLDALRVAGTSLPLTWDVLFYTVIISGFYADYHNSCWIPYGVVCTVVQDEASAISQASPSLATAVSADLTVAASMAPYAGVDLSPLQSAINAAGATTRGTAAYATAQSCLTQARNSIENAVNIADAAIMAISATTPASAQDGVSSLLAATDLSGQLTALASAASYLTRTALNLANAST